MLAVRIRHLPPDSATVTALNGGEPDWSRLEVLTTDLWSALAGKEHPAVAKARRGRKPVVTAERARKLRAARAHARERRRQIATGELT